MGRLLHLWYVTNRGKKPLPAFPTMCKKIPLHHEIGIYYFCMRSTFHTQGIQSATTKRGKREVRSEYFCGNISRKEKLRRATPGTGTSRELCSSRYECTNQYHHQNFFCSASGTETMAAAARPIPTPCCTQKKELPTPTLTPWDSVQHIYFEAITKILEPISNKDSLYTVSDSSVKACSNPRCRTF